MLELAFAFIAIGGLVAAFGGGQVSAALLAGAVAVAAAFARLAFDAIVQRRLRLTPTAVGRSRSSRPSSRWPGPGCLLYSRAHPHPPSGGLPDRHGAGRRGIRVLRRAGGASARGSRSSDARARVRSKVKERRRALKDHEDLPPPDPGARR